MRATTNSHREERQVLSVNRGVADQAFSRAAGAPLVAGNCVRLLKDAGENYPAWLNAISEAKNHVYFESYIIYDDQIGDMFADALIAKARDGVSVRLCYDWMGSFGKAGRQFWRNLRDSGVEVRCYNPPRFDSPFGWLSRDHRKMLSVDGEVAFVSGLCLGQMWAGQPEKGIEPWRDTGIEVRGPAVTDVEHAFAQVWAMTGNPIPESELSGNGGASSCGEVDVRVVASLPATAGMFRLDQLIVALARKRLWLTDAYYAGTSAYVQGLRAAALDGVDVRLLVPNSTDIPLLRPLSRSGYRSLLEAGVRVFEWNGAMLHAKTAIADDHWARVGSTNLNIASWMGNCELDVVIEDDDFARQMANLYRQDLTNATEIVLDSRRKLRAPGRPRHPHSSLSRGSGSAGRAAAGAVRIGYTIGAAFTNRRVLDAVEARLTSIIGALLLVLAVTFAFFPRVLAYPLAVFSGWIAAALLYRGFRLYAESKAPRKGG